MTRAAKAPGAPAVFRDVRTGAASWRVAGQVKQRVGTTITGGIAFVLSTAWTAQAGCTMYRSGNLPRPATYELTALNRNETALLGFYPWKATVQHSSWKQTEYRFDLDTGRRLPGAERLGRPVGAFPVSGHNEAAAERDLLAFRTAVMRTTAGAGRSLVDEVLESRDGRLFLKRRSVRHYLLGLVGPSVQSPTRSCRSSCSPFLGALTLGLFPIFEDREKSLLVFLFDAELRLLQPFEYHGSYHALSAWWLAPWAAQTFWTQSQTVPDEVYAPDIRLLESDLALFVRTGKHPMPGRPFGAR